MSRHLHTHMPSAAKRFGAWIATALLFANSGIAHAAPECAREFEGLAIPQGIFLATPRSPAVPQYLENARLAYRRVGRYLDRPAGAPASSPASPEVEGEYWELMREMHRDLVGGWDGKNTFRHPGSGFKSFGTESVRGGELRDRGRTYYFSAEDERERPGLAAVRRILGARSSGREVRESVLGFGRGAHPAGQDEVSLSFVLEGAGAAGPATPERTLSYFRDRKSGAERIEGMKVRYPAVEELPGYIRAMEQEFTGLREVLRKEGLTPAEREGALDSLAEYVRLGAIAHLFDRVNMSLVMIEANVVLERLGMRPVYHGELDVLANGLDRNQFREAFHAYVADPARWVTGSER